MCSADGKGVPIHREIIGEQKDEWESDKSQKAGKKKMALVGAVYTIDAYKRSAKEALEALFRDTTKDPTERSARRPKPQHKRVRTSLLRDDADSSTPSMQEIFGWIADEVKFRNPYAKSQ